jgi:anti-sigma-K factor RskA
MSDERCLPHRDNLAAYALSALDAENIPALEDHLAGCPDCQAELEEYLSITAGLLQAVPPRKPSQKLRHTLMNRLPVRQSRVPKPLATIFERFPLWQAASTLALLFLLILNVFSSMQIRDLRQQQAALAKRLSHDQTAIAMLAYPSTKTLPVHADVPGIAGSMLVDEDKSTAVLVLWNLPPLGAEQTYQIWLIDANGKRLSGGLFRPVTGQGYTTATVQSPRPFGEFVGIGVTVEPEGGSEGPTSSRVLGVDL